MPARVANEILHDIHFKPDFAVMVTFVAVNSSIKQLENSP
jgi:hypothetical protein